MKRWQETTRIFERLARLGAEGRRAALATVVRIQGSAYRRPGAKLLVEDDGAMTGSVSGGCLEQHVREVGLTVGREGVPRLLYYDTDDTAPWGLGLGCNGKVDVFVQPAPSADASEAAAALRAGLGGEEPFAVATLVSESPPGGRALVVGGDGLRAGSTGDRSLDRAMSARAAEALARRESRYEEIGSTQVFTEVLEPPPQLLIAGAGDDAIPLAATAAAIGFRVTVADHRSPFLTPERFPDAWQLVLGRPEAEMDSVTLGPSAHAVTMTHSYEGDREWLRRLLRSEVRYIGVLGPRVRTQKLLAELGAADCERIFGPVGLDLGGEGPEQVALSIAAELLAFWSRRSPQPLREREGPIHGG